MAKSLTCLLVTISSGEEVTQKVVTDSSFFIGRSHDCAVAFSGLNVSRHHVRVKNKGGKIWVEDLSANGTFVNGERIDKNRLTPLEMGDQLRLGSASATISILALERAFSDSVVEEAELEEKDRDGVMNLVHGAHAEAARLMKLGKEVHDGFVKAAEERAAELEAKMSADHAAVMTQAEERARAMVAEAEEKGRILLDQARRDRDAVVASAEHAAEEASKATTARLRAEALASAENEARENVRDAIRDLETLLAERDQARDEIESNRAENDRLKVECEGLEAVLAEMREQERRRADLALQVTRLEQQQSEAEKELAKTLADGKAAVEKDGEDRRRALDEELTQLRLGEMERLKRDRAEALSELARERERLVLKIMADLEKSAASSVGVEIWRSLSEEAKAVLTDHLQLGSLSSGSGEELTPLVAQVARRRAYSRLSWTLQGLVLGLALWAGGNQALQYFRGDADPVKTAAEEQARRIQEDLERRKFNPEQDDGLRDTYVDAVLYTRGFVDNYRASDFQKHWVKEASGYFLKKWKVQEEAVVETIAKTVTLVGTLYERKEAIHPDHVEEGLKKMRKLEQETLGQIKELLGSEVRIEAFKRLEKKVYLDFFAARAPATSEGESVEK